MFVTKRKRNEAKTYVDKHGIKRIEEIKHK